MLSQFNRVVLNCEIQGFRVHAFCCDAGSWNAKLFKMLREVLSTARTDAAWLPLSYVSFPHPFRMGARFFLFHCSAHVFKALRNALYASRAPGGVQGSRILRNVDPLVPITWAWIAALYHWDQSQHNGARTQLNQIFQDSTARCRSRRLTCRCR